MQNIRKGAVALMASLAAVLVAGTAHAEFLMSGSLNLSAGFATTRNIAAGSVQVLGTPGSLMIPQSAFALTRSCNALATSVQLASCPGASLTTSTTCWCRSSVTPKR